MQQILSSLQIIKNCGRTLKMPTIVARKVDADETRHPHHLANAVGSAYSLVHRLVRQYIDVVATHRCSFGHLQLLQVATQSGLGQLESLLLQGVQQFVLAS